MVTKDAQDGAASMPFPSGDSQDPPNALLNDDNPLAMLLYAGAALVLLPILYKLGVGASLLVLVLTMLVSASSSHDRSSRV